MSASLKFSYVTWSRPKRAWSLFCFPLFYFYDSAPFHPCSFSPLPQQEHFEDFFEDIFDELAKYGDVEQVNVCDNLGDHLVGNVYVKFTDEEGAARAMKALQVRFLSLFLSCFIYIYCLVCAYIMGSFFTNIYMGGPEIS